MGAINNSINVGRDRATTQAGQEKEFFNQLNQQTQLEQRRGENLLAQVNKDRAFDYGVTRDVRTDFTTDRAFSEHVSEFDKNFGRLTALDAVAAKERGVTDALNERKVKLDEIAADLQKKKLETGLDAVDERRRSEADVLRHSSDLFNIDAATGTVTGVRPDAPGGTFYAKDPVSGQVLDFPAKDIKGTPAPDLETLDAFVNNFKGSSNPAIKERVAVAEAEVQRRSTPPPQPVVDEATTITKEIRALEVAKAAARASGSSKVYAQTIKDQDSKVKQLQALQKKYPGLNKIQLGEAAADPNAPKSPSTYFQ